MNIPAYALRFLLCQGLVGTLSTATQAASPSEAILEQTQLRRGLCAVIGDAGNLPVELARGSELLVHVRHPDAAQVNALRQQAAAAGLGIDRLTAETGPVDHLPYVDNSVDLIVTQDARPASVAEMLRVLRPEGQALLQASPSREAALTKALRQALGTPARRWMGPGDGVWLTFSKPPMAGADDWSHWEKEPDNNPVSKDQIIKAPYMTQFLADPLYIGMPSVTTAAAGRTFLAIGHIAHHEREWDNLLKIIARNGYNGQVLWERKLPEGYLVHRSAFIATRETFFMIDGDHCLMLDPQTGTELDRIQVPTVPGDWKWMALHEGRLYALIGKPDPQTQTMKGDRSFGGWSWGDLSQGYYGKRVPFGFGHTLVCLDLKQKEVLWSHQEEEGQEMDSRGLAIQGNRIFTYSPDHHLRCLTADTGSLRWTNEDPEVLGLIERPGKGLISTPGFRTACLMVASPDALVIQGQTRMKVLGLSTKDGKLLWQKDKVTNNPNALFIDGKFVLGVGARGSHVVIDPVTGAEEDNLGFVKRACTRLTASTDSLFCRGEGMLRYDREAGKVLVDGAARPACNDGAMPANGLLYLGPWQCDCNLSIIGVLARTSAGDFQFNQPAKEGERLESQRDFQKVEAFPVDERDWPTYRSDIQRSASSPVPLALPIQPAWHWEAPAPLVPSAPVAAGGLVLFSGSDGRVRAVAAGTGALRWEHLLPAPVKYPPTVDGDRAFVGCSDGYAYALEAATGRLLWRFRAAPAERHIMVYGHLTSTWPVNSGVLIRDGIAYFAAGIIDHDGTHVYAVNATTGELVWQNNTSGHLNAELRKGVSVQGNLTIAGDHLVLAGGNQVSPARFELKTGKLVAPDLKDGTPKANNGHFVGLFQDTLIAGGRILHSSPRNVSSKNYFDAYGKGKQFRFNLGGIPPAWSGNGLAYVDTKYGKLAFAEAAVARKRMDTGYLADDTRPARPWTKTLAQSLDQEGELKWKADFGEKFEVLSLAVCPNAILAVVRSQEMFRSQRQWWLTAFRPDTGKLMFRHELKEEPLPGGLLIDRQGRIMVSGINGSLQSFTQPKR